MSSDTLDVSVGYGICVVSDQGKPKRAVSIIQIRLKLCTADGTNLSSPSITVMALGDVRTSGRANWGNVFRYVGDGYVFNLSTKGMAPGSHERSVAVSGDPTSHAVLYTVR